MYSFLPSATEPNLAKAGNLLFVELAVGIALAFALEKLGHSNDLVFAGIFLFNLWPAFYFGKAAHAKGKSKLAYCLLSALPPGALIAYSKLRNQEIFSN
jgi:hypothetical protein